MAEYKMPAEQKKYAEEVIGKQPAFETKSEALVDLRRRYAQEDIRQLWQEPNGGKFLVATGEAWEMMGRLGYKQIYSTADVFRMMSTDEIEEA